MFAENDNIIPAMTLNITAEQNFEFLGRSPLFGALDKFAPHGSQVCAYRRRLRAGEVVGEISVLDGSERSANAVLHMQDEFLMLVRRGIIKLDDGFVVPASPVELEKPPDARHHSGQVRRCLMSACK